VDEWRRIVHFIPLMLGIRYVFHAFMQDCMIWEEGMTGRNDTCSLEGLMFDLDIEDPGHE
jgi:hypothetical protein